MPAIFISHSSLDQNVADDVKTELAGLGFERVFLDFDKATGIGAGESWEKRLYEELSRCHAVVLVLTPNWLASKWCFAELQQARALGKIILPIVCAPLGERKVLPEIQAVDLLDWNAGGLDRLHQRLRVITNELARGFTLDLHRSPYPGIHAFETEDAAIYFGRDDETRAVIERLEARRTQGGARFLIVIGASGAGKSSLLKAGVLPQLARRRSEWLLLPPMRPEKAPLEALAKTIAQQTGRPQAWRSWHEILSGAAALDQVDELLKDLRVGDARAARILLPIDQFEEVFTVAAPAERAAFLRLLASALDPARDLPVMVIATGRSDVLAGLIEGGELARVTETYLLEPMPIDRVPRLVEGPAAVAGLNIERGLPEMIARNVESAEALPLLAHALWLLYRRSLDDKKLTVACYQGLGDAERGLNPIQNSVRLVAAQAIAGLGSTQQELDALRDAFVPHLVRLRLDDGKRVRQPARMSELPPGSLRPVRALIEARLLSTRGTSAGVEPAGDARDAIVEVTHEALLKAWPMLDQWLTDEHTFLSDIERIRNAQEDWARSPENQKDMALLGGLLLARARDWLVRHPKRFLGREMQAVGAFIAASAAADDAERARIATQEARSRRMQRWLLRGAVASAVVFAVLAGLAIVEERKAGSYLDLTFDETDALVSNISSELRDRIGISQDAIRRILDIIDSRFDHLAAVDADLPRLRLSRAAMLRASVDNYIGLGDTTEATRRARACVDIVRPMARDAPNDLGLAAELGRCLEKLGDASLERSAFNDAAAAYRESIAIRRRVLASAPDDTGDQLELCHVLTYDAFALVDGGKAQEAAPPANESLGIATKLIGIDPANARWQRDYAESLNADSMILASTNRSDEALPGYRQAANIARDLLAKDPGNATLERYLSNLLANLAMALMNLSRHQEAIDALQDGLKYKRHLVLVDPDNSLWQRELAITLNGLGNGQIQLNKADDALASFLEGQRVARSLVDRDPKNALWRQELMMSLFGVTNAKVEKGDIQGARTAADDTLKAIAILETLDVAQLGDSIQSSVASLKQDLLRFLATSASK